MMTKAKLIVASFIIGALFGAAGLNWVLGRHLDTAELEIRKLRLNLEDQSEKISALEKKLSVKQNLSVNEIQVQISLKDEYEKLELETVVKKLLKDLIGKEVKELDPALVVSIVDKRIVETVEHKFRLTVKGALISEKLIMYIEAKEIKEIPINN